MANFIPFKKHMFNYLDRIIVRYDLASPFLDVGCGIGDLSVFLAAKGWKGKAIDSSDIAIERAEDNLRPFPEVAVKKESLYDENNNFKTIFLWDVIEHVKDDEAALKKIASLLSPGGYLLMSVPSNRKEWRWDDDFYGHYRRYSAEEISGKLVGAGLAPIILYDITYPFFWAMRRLYTRFKSSPKARASAMDMEAKTSISSTVNAWDLPFISVLLNSDNFFWRALSRFQFLFFKNKLKKGHEMLVLAQKRV